MAAQGGYLCGTGTVDPGWSASATGVFSATGRHAFGGGPVPSGGRPSYPARYDGQVTGDVLVLTVTVTDLGQVLGPFTLRRNGPVVTERCF